MKTLVLVRHAHRDTDDPSADNGLTPKGRKQAEAIRHFFKERFGKKDAALLSSPKKRCLQTLEPLADRLETPLTVDERLLEGGDLEGKTSAFLSWWRGRSPDLVVACSHGDWIPLFLKRAIGVETPLKKGGWVELSLKEGETRLECLMQELPAD